MLIPDADNFLSREETLEVGGERERERKASNERRGPVVICHHWTVQPFLSNLLGLRINPARWKKPRANNNVSTRSYALYFLPFTRNAPISPPLPPFSFSLSFSFSVPSSASWKLLHIHTHTHNVHTVAVAVTREPVIKRSFNLSLVIHDY